MLSRHTKRAILGLAFGGAALAVVVAATHHYFSRQALELLLEQERASLVPPQPMLVTVERTDRTVERPFAVRLEPFRRSAVAAEAAGRVEEVLVEPGDFVEAGAVLLRLDATLAELNAASARAAVQAAEARLSELERRVREAERLTANQAIPETQLAAARAEAEVQVAELDRLRVEAARQEEMLARHVVRAPFAGHVNQRQVEPGDSVGVNQPVVSLVLLDSLEARFFVSDTEVQSFQPGDSLPLTVASHPGEEFEAVVTAVARSADLASGLFLVEGEVANPGQRLNGGIRGRIVAPITEYANRLFIPASAVRFEGARSLVQVGIDGEQELREVEIGPEVDGFYPVLAGLEEGEILVVR